jgi:hypothetical protein
VHGLKVKFRGKIRRGRRMQGEGIKKQGQATYNLSRRIHLRWCV